MICFSWAPVLRTTQQIIFWKTRLKSAHFLKFGVNAGERKTDRVETHLVHLECFISVHASLMECTGGEGDNLTWTSTQPLPGLKTPAIISGSQLILYKKITFRSCMWSSKGWFHPQPGILHANCPNIGKDKVSKKVSAKGKIPFTHCYCSIRCSKAKACSPEDCDPYTSVFETSKCCLIGFAHPFRLSFFFATLIFSHSFQG